MTRLILYSTSACHLCEQALELLRASQTQQMSIDEVDISESEQLFERYGVLIPVLRRVDTGTELNWPFTSQDIAKLLSAD